MFTAIVCTLVFLIVIDGILRWHRRQKLPNIPEVTNVPLVGIFLQVFSFHSDNLHLKFEQYVRRFGKTFRGHLFNISIVITSDPRYVEELLSSHKHLHKHMLYMLLRSWLGNGLLLSHGSAWQTMRKIITPAFHFKILEDFVDVFDRQTNTMIEKLQQYADANTVVDIYPPLGLLTLDIIAETAMGVQINAQNNAQSEFVQAVKEVTNILATRFIRPHLAYRAAFKSLAPHLFEKQMSGIKILHRYTDNIIEQRRTSLKAGSPAIRDEGDEQDLGIKKRMALLDVLLNAATISGESLSDEQIRDEVNTFMFEGHDTTTSATAFCLFLISRHPTVQEKLFEEIRSYFGDGLARPVTYGDLMQLSYLNAVVKESLRIYPPIPAIGRWLKEDCKLDDVTLPAGTNVIILLWMLLRDPEIFPEPEEFRPERHLENTNAKANAFSNIPFSAGPRNCIGQRFALFEMKTIIIKILRHYKLLPLGESVQPSIKIILRSRNGINVGLMKRQY